MPWLGTVDFSTQPYFVDQLFPDTPMYKDDFKMSVVRYEVLRAGDFACHACVMSQSDRVPGSAFRAGMSIPVLRHWDHSAD